MIFSFSRMLLFSPIINLTDYIVDGYVLWDFVHDAFGRIHLINLLLWIKIVAETSHKMAQHLYLWSWQVRLGAFISGPILTGKRWLFTTVNCSKKNKTIKCQHSKKVFLLLLGRSGKSNRGWKERLQVLFFKSVKVSSRFLC